MWGSWKPDDRILDTPYADGQRTLTQFRSRSCAKCSTGSLSETAYFFGSEHVWTTEAGPKAADIIRAIEMTDWIAIGKGDDGERQLFAPVRLFVPSLRPLMVMSIPWKFKTDPTSAMAAHNIAEETQAFSEMNSRTFEYMPQYWAKGLRNPFEFRGSLPREATEVTVHWPPYRLTVKLPIAAGKSVSTQVGMQPLRFTRDQDGKIQIDFR